MSGPTIKAKILKIQPSSVYEEKIYDQAVLIELSDGVIIDIFDCNMIASSNVIDEIKNITISVFLSIIEKRFEPKYGVKPATNIEGKQIGNGHVFYGRLMKVDEKNCQFVIDVGVGKILVSLDRSELNDFDVGDFVCVFSVRADLKDIQGMEPQWMQRI